MNEELEFFIKMKNFFEGIDELKKNVKDKIYKLEQERNDLLHKLELVKLNAVELTKLSVELKKVLLERRKYKDELEKINIIKNFADKYNKRLIVGDILNLIKNLKELEKSFIKRSYRPRIRKDIGRIKQENLQDIDKKIEDLVQK